MKETCKDLVIYIQSCIHILDKWLGNTSCDRHENYQNDAKLQNMYSKLRNIQWFSYDFIYMKWFLKSKKESKYSFLTFIFTNSLLILTKMLYISSTWCSNLSTSWLFIFKLRLDIVFSVFVLALSSASRGGCWKEIIMHYIIWLYDSN